MSNYQEDQRAISVTRPTAEALGEMTVRRVDWQRIRDNVKRLDTHMPAAIKDTSTWAAAFLGIWATCLISLIVTVKTDPHDSWQTVLWGCGVALGAICTVVCLFAGGQNRKLREAQVDKVCEEMDEVKRWFDPVPDDAP